VVFVAPFDAMANACICELPVLGSIIRAYDTSSLHWKDEILRIRHMEAEIAAMQKEIDIRKQKAVAAMERLDRTKKWLGIID